MSADIGHLLARAKATPSSLNDALRTIDILSDALERLSAERDKLEVGRNSAVDEVNFQTARAEAAEAEIERLREQLAMGRSSFGEAMKENDRLREQLASAKDALSDWLAFAEEELPEFILDDEPCDGEALCPKCRSSGCVQDKIERTRAALTDDLRGDSNG